MNRVLLVATLIACAWTGWTPGEAKVQQPTFTAQTDVVSVNVSVNRGRRPVTDLKAEEFELTDNGVRQTIDLVSREHVSFDITLVLTGRGLDGWREHADSTQHVDVVRRRLHSTDRLRVVWVNDDVSGGMFGADHDILGDVRTRRQSLGLSTSASFDVPEAATSGYGVALTDGLFYALAWPVSPDRRHVVIAFTDGWDSVSTLETGLLPRLASRSDAVLHAVLWATPFDGPASGGGRNIYGPGPLALREWDAGYRALDAAVIETGGTLLRNSRAADALATIFADLRSSYILRYSPRGVAATGWHELKVRVTRPGSHVVRARRGYEGNRP